jgi:pSer/pThr/pTyr-binding forkhead associated (FHA) protein
MLLRLVNHEGRLVEMELGPEPLIIGRGPDAGLRLEGEKVSRHHAEIRYWDGDYVMKDLHATNGTFVNDRRVEVAVIRPGDRVRIGEFQIQVEARAGKGATTILREISQEMETGKKGYRTMLREIVQDAESTSRRGSAKTPPDSPPPEKSPSP